MDIASLHSVKIIALRTLGALLDHAVPMCQFAIEDVAEDLGVAVRMGWEAGATCDSVLIEDSQRSEILKFWIVIVCKAEGMIRVQPAVVAMATLAGASRDDFGVRESFGHCVLDCVDSCHGVLD